MTVIGLVRMMVTGVALCTAGAAMAQVIDGGKAKRDLYKPDAAEVQIFPQAFLAADQAALLEQVGLGQKYYGAIAASPDEGLMSEATVAAANFHDTEAASRSALASCEAKRTGKSPCVVVAVIRPKGYQPGRLQLSADATTGFLETYLKDRAAKAFATSRTTGHWGIGASAETAVAACAAVAGATDCTVVVAD